MKEQVAECRMCTKKFARKDLLKRHMDSTHNRNQDQVIKCQFCDSAFTRSDSLKRHIVSCKEVSTGSRQAILDDLYKVSKGRRRHSCTRCSRLKMKCSRTKDSTVCDNCLKMKVQCLSDVITKKGSVSTLDVNTFTSIEAPTGSANETNNPTPADVSNSTSIIVSEACCVSSSSGSTMADTILSHLKRSANDGSNDFTTELLTLDTHDMDILTSQYPQSRVFNDFLPAFEDINSINWFNSDDLYFMSAFNFIPDNNYNFLSPTKETSLLMHKCDQLTENLTITMKQWLNVGNLDKFISLYFRNFQLHTPFLHRPSFDAVKTPDSLLYCIALIGALYSDLESDITTSLSQLRKAFDYIESKEKNNAVNYGLSEDLRYTFTFSETSQKNKYPLHVIQAYICLFNALTWSSTNEDRAFARGNFSKLMSIGRLAGLTTIEHAINYSKNEKGWREWIKTEMMIRTIYSIFLLDTSFLIFFNNLPRIVPSELDLPLPSHHMSWDAESYSQWATTYKPRPKFLSTVKYIVNADEIEENFTLLMYDFFVIIHALYVNMWFQKQLMNVFTGSQIDQQKKALNNWKTLWNRSLKVIPKDEWAKFGFCRNAMEYYWLARVFLISREKRLSLEFGKPDLLSSTFDKDFGATQNNGDLSDQEMMKTISIMGAVRDHTEIKEVDEIQEILHSGKAQSPLGDPVTPGADGTDREFKTKGNIFKFLLWDTK